jgi:uncharacterized protein
MLLDLTRIRKATDQLDRVFQPADLFQEGEVYWIVAPVHLVAEIHKDHARFRVSGEVAGELAVECSRCLAPYRIPVQMRFDHRYLPQAESSTEGDREVEKDDFEISYYQDDQIDLAELIREQFYLTLPMKPLCTDNCKGLCPQCGTNLNLARCGCVQVWEDSRLAALKSISSNHA